LRRRWRFTGEQSLEEVGKAGFTTRGILKQPPATNTTPNYKAPRVQLFRRIGFNVQSL